MNKITKNDEEALYVYYGTNFFAFCKRGMEVIYPGKEFRDVVHVRAIIYLIVRIMLGEVTRAVVNIPPRYYKSTLVSVLYVAFVLGRDPTKKIAVVSYSGDLAAELHNDCRDLMSTQFYKKVFPGTKIKAGKNTEVQIKTTKGGGRRSVSTGASITGFGADIIM